MSRSPPPVFFLIRFNHSITWAPSKRTWLTLSCCCNRPLELNFQPKFCAWQIESLPDCLYGPYTRTDFGPEGLLTCIFSISTTLPYHHLVFPAAMQTRFERTGTESSITSLWFATLVSLVANWNSTSISWNSPTPIFLKYLTVWGTECI